MPALFLLKRFNLTEILKRFNELAKFFLLIQQNPFLTSPASFQMLLSYFLHLKLLLKRFNWSYFITHFSFCQSKKNYWANSTNSFSKTQTKKNTP